jgi:hypothetical protein
MKYLALLGTIVCAFTANLIADLTIMNDETDNAGWDTICAWTGGIAFAVLIVIALIDTFEACDD